MAGPGAKRFRDRGHDESHSRIRDSVVIASAGDRDGSFLRGSDLNVNLFHRERTLVVAVSLLPPAPA